MHFAEWRDNRSLNTSWQEIIPRIVPMRYRKLRIAWSVAWSVASVLLIGLWGRSYWWLDGATLTRSAGKLTMTSFNGSVDLSLTAFDRPAVNDFTWTLGHRPDQDLADWFAKRPWFVWVGNATWTNVALPYWAVSLPTATLAVAPWIQWSKRFSLRTLLIATTLIAVVLGIIVWMTRAG
jgi:hypothetical protein